MENEKYSVKGMSCAACQARVESAVKKVDGVSSCSVNLLTNSMLVSYDGVTSDEIISAVKKAGYDAELASEDTLLKVDSKVDKETKYLIIRLIVSFVLLIPLFYISMGYMVGWPIFGLENNLIVLAIIELVLSLAIMVINNKFFINGTKALFTGGPNMDTLVALGSAVSFIYSLVLFILMIVNKDNMDEVMRLSMNLSFETAGMVPTLITIGKLLESYSKGKTTNAIKSLINLQPKIAHVRRGDTTIDIEINEMVKGDIYIVRPGESFPADGIVVDGSSSVNEASLTGESLPIDKAEGDLVKSGTINLNGVLTCKAEKVGSETILAQIIKTVETASGTKTNISRITDRVSAIFVPTVIGIALLTFILWLIFGEGFVTSLANGNTTLTYAIERGVAVLVISCPCALGLATPVAIMVGNGKAAKNGILFKTAKALENVHNANIVVLDKTGTITKGMPEVSDVISLKGSENELLQVALSLEENSEHPLAKAIIRTAHDLDIKPLTMKEVEAIPGVGVKGIIGKDTYLIANEKEVLNRKIKFNEEQVTTLKKQGKTISFIIKNNDILGLIVIKDSIKEDSKEAIENFKKLGLVTVMLTGDNKVTAMEIAKESGIDYVIGEVLPNDKLEVIKELKKYGKVIMIGDGINDAPALTEADIGVAIARGSDIAIDSSDVVLMKSTLLDAVKMINISRITYRNILENLFWAFFYNIIMIPLAAGALTGVGLTKLKPWMGSAAMALSSVTVVLNALRINLYNLEKNRKTRIKELTNIDIKEIENSLGRTSLMEIELKITGMMCMHCVANVEKALKAVPGVKEVIVSLDKGNAIVKGENLDEEALKQAVINAGYEAK